MDIHASGLSGLSLDGPAPVDYSSDEDDVIVVGHAPKPKPEPSDVVDLTMSDNEDDDGDEDVDGNKVRGLEDQDIRIPDDVSTWPYVHDHSSNNKEVRLHHAVIHGDLETIKSIFDEETHPAGLRQLKMDVMNEQMQQAIANDHGDLVAYFLTKDDEFQNHHIETAIKYKAYRALQAFLDANWDINRRRSQGQPPLLSLALVDRDVTKWFLDHGANPNATCKFDISPLSLAVRDAPLDIIELLFEHGGSVEHGQLLHYAAWRYKPDCVEVAKLLLHKGCHINAMKFAQDPAAQKALGGTKFCGTPLAEAARAGHVAMVQFFLENGANPWTDQTRYQAWSAHAWAQFNIMKEPDSKPYRVVLEMLVRRMYGVGSDACIEAGDQPQPHTGTLSIES